MRPVAVARAMPFITRGTPAQFVRALWFEGVEQAGIQALGVSVVGHLYV